MKKITLGSVVLSVGTLLIVGATACSVTTTNNGVGSDSGSGGGGPSTTGGDSATPTPDSSTSSGGDSATPPTGDASPGTCATPIETPVAACNTCLGDKCCTESGACAKNADCMSLLNCAMSCSDDAGAECTTACANQYPNGGADAQTLSKCIVDKCKTECN